MLNMCCDNITQDCLQEYRAYYNCLRLDLIDEYNNELQIGSKCSKKLFHKIEIITALLDSLCNIDLESPEDNCLTTDEICNILNVLDLLLT